MPRPERPVDPEGGAVARFALGLRELRRRAGSPGYRELAQRAHYSPTTLSQAAGGEVLPSLPVTLAYVRGCGGDVEEWERRWRATAAELDTGAADDSLSGGCTPYVGLAAYGPEDAEWFHGRERVVDELVTRVGAHRFVTVLGPSGSGKSSVLRACLLPRLRADGWMWPVVFTPGAHPLEECAVQLAELLDCAPGVVAAELAADARGLHRLVERVLVDRPQAAEVVLVIDQFEEVFTLCRDAEERARFVTALVAAGRSAGSRCRLVMSVRADFYPQCLQDADLATLLNDGQVAVGPMTVDELRRVIVQPARRAGCVVEGSLLATLVAHAHGRVGALPLLSHALLETWRRRSGNTLTLAGFERAGGIDGALAKTAEAVFASLTEEQQSAARQLFLRLVALGDGAPDTKRRVAKEELDDDDTAILTAFGDARLVVLSEHGVEITHEALIGAWPRLRSWLADDREGQRIHRKLTEATATWQEHGRDPGALLRGTRLAEVAAWARGHRSAANHAETAFLDASVLADDRDRAAVRHRAHVVRGLVALLTLLLVATIVTGIQAVRAGQSATQQGNVAIALNAIREAERLVGTNPELAAQISLAAYRLHPSQPTASSLVTHTAAATAVPLPTGGANFSLTPDGRLIAAAVPDVDNTVVLQVGSRAITPLGTVTGGKFPPRFSPDGELLLTVDNDAVSRLWGVTNPADPTTPSEIPASSTGGAFSPDTDVLVTTDATRSTTDPARGGAGTWAGGPTTRIWSIADTDRPRHLATLPNTTAEVTAFADRGTAMATITDEGPAAPKRLAIWDLTDPAAPTIATYIDMPSDAQPESAAFARGGRILYVGDSAGNITAWNVDTRGDPEELSSVEGNGKPIDDLTASPDGRTLASSDTEGRLTIWDISTSENPRPTIQVTNPRGGLDGMSFAADSDTVLAVVLAIAPDKPSLVHWRMNPARSARALCQGSPARMTEEDWNDYLAGAPYQPPCA